MTDFKDEVTTYILEENIEFDEFDLSTQEAKFDVVDEDGEIIAYLKIDMEFDYSTPDEPSVGYQGGKPYVSSIKVTQDDVEIIETQWNALTFEALHAALDKRFKVEVDKVVSEGGY